MKPNNFLNIDIGAPTHQDHPLEMAPSHNKKRGVGVRRGKEEGKPYPNNPALAFVSHMHSFIDIPNKIEPYVCSYHYTRKHINHTTQIWTQKPKPKIAYFDIHA